MARLCFLLPVFLLQILPIFALHKTLCFPTKSATLQAEKNFGLKIGDSNVTINYDLENVYVNPFGAKSLEIFLDTANVVFKGHITEARKRTDQSIAVNFHTKTVVIQRINDIAEGKRREQCNLTASQNFDIITEFSEDIEAAIIALTESCLESFVCENYDSFTATDFLLKQKYNPISVPNCHRQSKNRSNSPCKNETALTYNPQPTINAMTDFALAVVLKKIANKGNGNVAVPDINQGFSTGSSIWNTSGNLIAKNGTFSDLRTLKRVSDVVFKHDGLLFSVASTYRLAKATAAFEYYKVRYGKINVDGKLSVDINGITVRANAASDFNSKPCKMRVLDFDIIELGEIKVKLTGLSIFNSPAASIIQWIIKSKIFDSFKSTITQKIEEINCEIYRP